MMKQKMIGVLAAISVIGIGAVASIPAFASTTTTSTTNQQAVTEHRQHMQFEPLKTIASILHMDVKTLRAELKSGKSIAQVAQSKGVSEQALLLELQKQLKAHLDTEVSKGKITADKEKEILAKSGTRFQKLVEHKGLFKDQKIHKRKILKEVSSIIGIDEKTLQTELKNGKSIAEVAQSKGISEQDLIQAIKAKLKSNLDQKVAKGKITAEKQAQILSNSDARIKKLVERKFSKPQG